jgi:hypothetical protein
VTSNAPRVGSKRRRDVEPIDEEAVTEDGSVRSKRARPGALDPVHVPLPPDEAADVAREASPTSTSPLSPTVEKGVKEVTLGVGEVVLEGNDHPTTPEIATSSVDGLEAKASEDAHATIDLTEAPVATETLAPAADEKKDVVPDEAVTDVVSPTELTTAATASVAPVVDEAQSGSEISSVTATTTAIDNDDTSNLTPTSTTTPAVTSADTTANTLPTPSEESQSTIVSDFVAQSSSGAHRVPSSASPEPLSSKVNV